MTGKLFDRFLKQDTSMQAFPGGPNPGSPRWPACAIAPILAKLAKHLALLATVLIIGGASGRSSAAQIGILIVVVLAALLHSIARTLQRRETVSGPPHRGPS
ncbi:MAG: hypothetical protein HYU31_05890 [Deltaproteobacteria bacterium]|nr:hypothetical protein [Deltaproteobacteria bacterium]MBI2180335.1 hypothetical protein [Deltaproteobacteria bacterium]MBI2229186.1 hypothetical protein [Deltaproteobacteria bacterium]MBI2363480.1 hypothetical protein [Deltaproteobacteria bacterium]MBI2534120.1 hypothetical protein [Deltaproteobacteria bacterium]